MASELKIDVEWLASNIALVLSKAHSDPKKKRVKVKHDRISMACPICGDSAKDNSQKRGHLFLNNLYYKCYNEGCKSTFTNLCKRYDVKIDSTKRLELIDFIDNNFKVHKAQEDEFILESLDKLITLEELQEWFDSGDGPLRAFKPVQYGSAVYNYMVDRGCPDAMIKQCFYEGIKHNGKWSEPFVVFLNMTGNKVIGMQERNLQSGFKRRFKIWTFAELYREVKGEDLDVIEAVGYNKLSYLFNIMNVNYDQEVTILEGYIDSLFVRNAIGAVGANTDFSMLTQDGVRLRFFFDNDVTGHKKSKEWLLKGYPVFLWSKLLDDLSKKTKMDPHKFKTWFNETITDANRLYKEFKLQGQALDKYYSTSKFDVLHIPYVKPVKKKKFEPKPISIHNVNWDNKIRELRKR